MPELPEVETIGAALHQKYKGLRLNRVTLNRPDLRFPFPDHFAQTLENRILNAVERRAKYMLWHFEGEETVLCHLGMTGRFTSLPDAAQILQPHSHVVFEWEKNNVLIYSDPRRFGFFDVCRTDLIHENRFLAHLAPEPLGDFETMKAHFIRSVHGKKIPIKIALLNQSVIVGVGNIYASEALWLAGISPFRAAGTLTEAESHTLSECVVVVLKKAVAAGGSTLKDYRTLAGDSGYFQHSFSAYDRAGQPCVKQDCRGTIEKRQQSGRSTYYCATCQE